MNEFLKYVIIFCTAGGNKSFVCGKSKFENTSSSPRVYQQMDVRDLSACV